MPFDFAQGERGAERANGEGAGS
ncbi:hypothetical protein SPHINGOT1_100043 [Sphingomonas sp. T1]|nr:hypothetical protein SPHINGOT1_100043 [Sphingomonas sp. T1]